ncbi:hypothetical protein [Streptacidiphilus pinicola]|nr:hypothetical protein [Streptacidiphilus pinicola]
MVLLHQHFFDPGRARGPALALSAAFAGVYLLAPEVVRRSGADVRGWTPAGRIVPAAALWLTALTALWLSMAALRWSSRSWWCRSTSSTCWCCRRRRGCSWAG